MKNAKCFCFQALLNNKILRNIPTLVELKCAVKRQQHPQITMNVARLFAA